MFLGIWKAVCICRVVCPHRGNLRRPQLSSLADPKALHRKEVKAKARLPTVPQSTEGRHGPNMHTAPSARLGPFLPQGFTGILVQSLPSHYTNQVETSGTANSKEHRIMSDKTRRTRCNPNKQQPQSWGRGARTWFPAMPY